MKKQIPNLVVYVALYAVIFGVSAWLLMGHGDSPTNGLLYIAMAVSVVAGVVKLALHVRKRQRQSA